MSPADLDLPLAAGCLVAWTNAWMTGSAPLDMVELVVPGSRHPVRFHGVPGESDLVSAAVLAGRLRAEGVTGLRLVVPAAGDALGLPGPRAVNDVAVDAGVAVVTIAPPGLPARALLPSPDTGVWDVVDVLPSSPPAGLPSLAEARRTMAETMRNSTSTLLSLDVARGRPGWSGEVAARQRVLDTLDLPPSMPSDARAALVEAWRIHVVVNLAMRDDGGALTGHEVAQRSEALRPLGRAARHELAAAFGSGIEPTRR